MTKKQTTISSIAIITGFSLWFMLIAYSSCSRATNTKQKNKSVFSLEKQEWLEKQIGL
jgi:hypothetical protein